jgi:hypothetical protein
MPYPPPQQQRSDDDENDDDGGGGEIGERMVVLWVRQETLYEDLSSS